MSRPKVKQALAVSNKVKPSDLIPCKHSALIIGKASGTREWHFSNMQFLIKETPIVMSGESVYLKILPIPDYFTF